MAARLQNKVACITGAAQGIGAGIAEAMAKEGAQIIIGDINDNGAQSLAKQIGANAVHLDVSSQEDWQALQDHVEEQFGRLDILVNNAGLELVKPMQDHSLAEWRKVMAVNVDGLFLGCKTFEALLRESGKPGSPASVINISSIAGLVGYPDQLAYNTSKGAVRHMSKSLAIEWAAHGDAIRCNSIHPGCIRTPMLEMAVDGWVENGSVPADDPWSAVAALCPLNTVGLPEDIAMGAIYLGSDESRFVTGIELVIDGGWVAR
ncbi:glucose 1-dehydrogenase [Sphingorhabdus sp. 109]|jgi:3(or 17)beta-hydroxysteroid dehydrogenase|uniref:glucose 1-dehydrogenase n=1 Tax=Sphingorhabdus sp. 109 TaxID=2653173 RepID=UPI0012F2748A|nr:glucose 1-dehydrogenase [Sphingorhabdus sp. 109]VWX57259.1 1,6-dihydroxycyclohexa-2,4-diene-1-carboxylate dehydrogenase [Sphingorhabdus sp. 109]